MRSLAYVVLAVVSLGCTPESDTSAVQQNLFTIARPLVQFPTGFEADDVTADERLVFTGVLPSASIAPAVVAASRATGNQVGTLPPPPGGFLLPTSIKVSSYSTSGAGTTGELIVIDNGGLPPTAHPVAYIYTYSHSPALGFSAALAATLPLPVLTAAPPSPPNGVGYASGLLVLNATTRLVTDAFVGGIWVCDASFVCQLGLASPDFAPAPAPTMTGVGRAPGGGVRTYTFQLPIPIFPGVFGAAYVALTDEVCAERASQPGGVYCIDRAALLNTAVNPFAKAKRTVVAPQIGVSDGGHGIAYDRFHPGSPWLYWVRALADSADNFNNTIRRVNVVTGQVQIVFRSNSLLDFSTGLDVLPPIVANSPLTNLGIAMGQEENNAALNVALGGVDAFVSPTLITEVSFF